MRQKLTRWAMSRPCVLLVDPPGRTGSRLRVEAELDRRAWPLAVTPADADMLLVLGEPGPQLTPAVDIVWSQMPWPRWRCHVDLDGDLGGQLDTALERLSGDAGDDEHPDQGETASLPMAGTAADRDGLELDSLHVSLGPVLPAWPTGLVLDGSLQGDVLTDARIGWMDGPSGPPEEELPTRIVVLDRMARFLDVAGWPAAAGRARRARNELLSGDSSMVDAGDRRARLVARRLRASASLRWSVRGVDDVLDRVRAWCELAAGDGAEPYGHQPSGRSPGPDTLDDLAETVEGHELAGVRLLVASAEIERLRTRAGPTTEPGAARG